MMLDGDCLFRTIQPVDTSPPSGTYYLELEDSSGSLLLEDGSFLLLESAP
jgi:hypothetical protein